MRVEKGAFKAFRSRSIRACMVRRPNENMDVLGHENISDQFARLTKQRQVKTFGQQEPPFVVR